MKNKFYRSLKDKRIAGVCSGLAKYTNTDVVLWRILFIFLFFAPYPAILTYILITLLTETIEYHD